MLKWTEVCSPLHKSFFFYYCLFIWYFDTADFVYLGFIFGITQQDFVLVDTLHSSTFISFIFDCIIITVIGESKLTKAKQQRAAQEDNL